MKKTLQTLALSVLALQLAACIVVTDDNANSQLLIENDSTYVIDEIRVTETSSSSWGPNLLGGDVLFPGESLAVEFTFCDYYDVLVVDELGAECVLANLDLCYDSAAWVIDDFTLDGCAFGKSTRQNKSDIPTEGIKSKKIAAPVSELKSAVEEAATQTI